MKLNPIVILSGHCTTCPQKAFQDHLMSLSNKHNLFALRGQQFFPSA